MGQALRQVGNGQQLRGLQRHFAGFGAQVNHRGKFRRAVLGQVLLYRTACLLYTSQVRQRAAALFSQKSPVNIQIVADQRAGNKDRLVLQFQPGLQFGQSLAGVARCHQRCV